MNNFKINNNVIDKKDIFSHMMEFDLSVYVKNEFLHADVRKVDYGDYEIPEKIETFLKQKFKEGSYITFNSTSYILEGLTNKKKYYNVYTTLFKTKKDLLKFKLGCDI